MNHPPGGFQRAKKLLLNFGRVAWIPGGGSVARLVNSRGVELEVSGKQVGFMFSIDLSGLGLTGCSLYSDILFSLPGILTRSAQPFDLPLPNDPTLLGGRAYLQGAAFDLGVNAAGIVTTNGGTMVLGS